MTDAGAQKALWDVRKAGLNIMMSMRGDGKPVSFIEDCAVPLEHLADYVDRLTRSLSRGTARAARGTRTRRSARCTCGRSSTCGATARRRCARSPRRRPRSCANTRARSRASTATGSCAANGCAWQFGPRLDARVRARSRTLFDPAGLMNPGKIVRAPRMDDATLFRFPPDYRTLPLDTGARLVGVERAERSGRPAR